MLKGKCALITGSTQGLGYAMAERLAAEGCHVVLNGFGDPVEIEAKRRQLEDCHGVRALHHGADLGMPGEIADLVETAERAFGAVDIVVNNAVVRHFSPLETFKVEEWDRALAVNLSSAFHVTRLALPGMRRRDFGRIVNISSVYGLFGTVNRIDYVTTKTALIGFTRAVALEVAGQNITCNAICPGSSPTPAIEQRLADFMAREGLTRDDAVRAFMASRQPSGRFVAMEGVAALAAFLCGPAGRDITGAAIPIDGGWSAS
ncbi:MAG: SDR family oxidoreductase [Reyranella sp.]|uniref:SDR family oxidoreductase n=1 Tax=Reyranella sp. TaxID=1929291 RepID=UPI0011FD1040|nr:SDR family oxidoreductase [Reyranella sp.]TAJ36885.1 MAG: SDR family oxidoreductase [Reyranella sp.]